MPREIQKLPEDPAELRQAAEQLVALVKSQALRIAKLEHQLAGHRRHRFGALSATSEQLGLALEEAESALGRSLGAGRQGRGQGEAQAQAVARGPAAQRDCAVAGRDLRRLRRTAQDAGRGWHRGTGILARPVRGEPYRSPAQSLLML